MRFTTSRYCRGGGPRSEASVGIWGSVKQQGWQQTRWTGFHATNQSFRALQGDNFVNQCFKECSETPGNSRYLTLCNYLCTRAVMRKTSLIPTWEIVQSCQVNSSRFTSFQQPDVILTIFTFQDKFFFKWSVNCKANKLLPCLHQTRTGLVYTCYCFWLLIRTKGLWFRWITLWLELLCKSAKSSVWTNTAHVFSKFVSMSRKHLTQSPIQVEDRLFGPCVVRTVKSYST